MTTAGRRVIFWAPRVLGLLYVAFLAVLSLDVFTTQALTSETIVALLMHAVVPAFMLLVVVIAWRYERTGAALLVGAGIFYSVLTRDHPSWILVIAGPVWVLALLFLASFASRGPSSLSA